MSAAEATLAEPPAGPASAAGPAPDRAKAIGGLPAAGAAGVALHGMLTARFGADLNAAWLDRDWLLRTLDREVAALDDMLTRQVNVILHAEPVQRMEARWRGLLYLVAAGEQSPLVKIKVLTVSWGELVRDLERASDFDQSELFQKVYSTEFGTPGGEPYGLLVGDYEVRHRPEAGHPTDDVGALNVLAMVAAASFSPVILGVAPSVLQVDGFRELARTSNIRGVF